jgi:NADH-quinone oxidoreductase subunit I
MTFLEYTGAIKDIVLTTMKGMGITLKQFGKVTSKGAITIQYPEQRDQLPMGSRGLLFNDVEDCISCKQCAAVCPVDCIYIEADKKEASEPQEFTKGGVKKTLNLRKFDIDISLCCYCGLCSAACPTDCLYHTKDYEYSVIDRDKHVMDYLDYRR